MPNMDSHMRLSGSQTPDIIVYPNRRRTLLWLMAGVISYLLCCLIFIFMLILMIVIPATRNGGAIFLALLMGGMGVAGFWPIWLMKRLFSSREPTLVITYQGVRVGKIYSAFEIMLPWEEIEAIGILRGGIEKNFGILPKSASLFFSRFSPSFCASIY